MGKPRPIQYFHKNGSPRVLSPLDVKKIASILLGELMQKKTKTSSDISHITRLIKELRDTTEFIDYKRKLKQFEDSSKK